MNREELKALGLTDEQIESVMKSHGLVVNKTKEQLESITTERDSLKEQLQERDTQLEELSKKAKDNDELTAEINRLKEENKTTQEQYETKLKEVSVNNAIKVAIAGKVHDEELVAGLIDKEKLVIDGEKIVGLDEQIKSLEETKAFLFKKEESNTKKPTFTTGQHQKGNEETGITAADFSKMTYKERLKFKQENPDQYKELVGK